MHPETHGPTAARPFPDSLARLAAALEAVPAPAMLLDAHRTIRWQNAADIQTRGVRVGHDFTEFVPPEAATRARSVLARALARATVAKLEVRLLGREGAFVPWRGRCVGVPIREGGRVAVVVDLGGGFELAGAAPQGASHGLTPRQVDVLRLLSAGATTAGIASALSVSPTTVRNHVAGLLAALGVHSRVEAVAAARSAGLLGASR